MLKVGAVVFLHFDLSQSKYFAFSNIRSWAKWAYSKVSNKFFVGSKVDNNLITTGERAEVDEPNSPQQPQRTF